ncbi:hypothetical protein ILYODFUR_025875 [Ilyodon furcidens]|uniref:Uncharacterized protein n=1 Tax=Ilyodon furcidens TaxID=33524 RepID=A0ABV0UCD2_9TELE
MCYNLSRDGEGNNVGQFEGNFSSVIQVHALGNCSISANKSILLSDGSILMSLNDSCVTEQTIRDTLMNASTAPDSYWICGNSGLRRQIPASWAGLCAHVMLASFTPLPTA